MINDTLEYLIKEACPSIVYRVRAEILQDNISTQELADYQTMICSNPQVQKILSWQNADGYFGTRLHTAPSQSKVWTHEGCVRYLLEMGLTKEDKKVKKSLEVMLGKGWEKECENSRAAKVFKYEMIRASLLVQAGHWDNECIMHWVKEALQAFRNVAEAENYTDLVYKINNQKLVFKEGKFVPVIYHLRVLAFSEVWRTKENMKMMEKAYERLYQWLPIPPMYYRDKSHTVAPLGNVCWPVNQDFNKDIGFYWLHFYEMSARMGMLGTESPFRKHFENLKNDAFRCIEGLDEYVKGEKGAYVNWSGYSGIALEGDWKRKQQRIRDFIFRVLLIEKYSAGICRD